MDSKWTVSQNDKNPRQATATQSICPCSGINCNRLIPKPSAFGPLKTCCFFVFCVAAGRGGQGISQCGESLNLGKLRPATRPCATTAAAYWSQIGSVSGGM